MGKYIGHRLVPRPELDNTFWTDSTVVSTKFLLFLVAVVCTKCCS